VSAAAFFDAARALKRELTGAADGLTQGEVDELSAFIGKWAPSATANPTALGDGAAFFASVRQSFGALDQSQVDGFERLLQAYGVARWPLAFAAYGLATGWRETAKKMQPVREAYWVTNAEEWRKKHLAYYPWYGRGDVQLTWQRNYERADEELSLGGALVADPDVALRPDISARVMVHGMEAGWFTGKRLADYLPLSGRAGFDAYKQARRIINGTDAWEEIAKNAQAFEAALIAGGWQ
jgi:putative chitinase